MATKITKEEERLRKSETPTATAQPQTVSTPQTSGSTVTQANTYTQNNTRYTPSASVTAANDYLKQLRDGGYNQQWSKTLDSLVNEYMGRGAFEYDPQSDAMWQQAKSEGLRQGQLAMRDATAQAAALSGGYGNSYAATVGNQVYQQAVADTMALQPQYIQAAYERYRNEGDELLQKANLAQSMDDTAWNRYMTELGLAQDEADRLYQREYNEFADAWDRDYQLDRDAVNDQWRNTEWQYKLDRDAVADQWRNTEWQYQLDRDKVADERYDTEWQHQLDREGIEDSRYAEKWQYQLDRDAVADQQVIDQRNWEATQNQLDRDHQAAQNQAEREWKTSENQADRDWQTSENGYKEYYENAQAAAEEETALAEDIMAARQTPAYQDAVVALGGLSADKQKAELYDMYISGDLGSGKTATYVVEALAIRFGLDPTELFADWY